MREVSESGEDSMFASLRLLLAITVQTTLDATSVLDLQTY